MVLALIPVSAFAQQTAPTGSAANFFANGTPVEITKDVPENAQEDTLDGFTATGTDAYISWQEGEAKKYIGVSSQVSVYGGADGSEHPVTVNSTSITMTGGTVYNIFGGNLGMKNHNAEDASSVTGDASITITGADAIVVNLLHGGGDYNTSVGGTATIKISDADLTRGDFGGCYINGGGHGNGSEGVRDIENGTMTTSAVVNKVNIEISNSKVYLVGAGGSGSTKVVEGRIVFQNSAADSIFLSGINGVIEDASLTISDNSTVNELAAVNRGFVGEGIVSIDNSVVTDLSTGAVPGCFGSDSGAVDGSAVTGTVMWDIGKDATIVNPQITPNIKSNSGAYEADFGGIIVEKEGDPLAFATLPFQPTSKNEVANFIITEGREIELCGISVTVPSGVSIANEGAIRVGENAEFRALNGSTVENGGTIFVGDNAILYSENNAISNAGSIDLYPGGEITGEIEGNEPVSPYYTIKATAGKGGSISPEGEITVREGDNAVFTIAAEEGYVIDDVKVDQKSVGAVLSYAFEDVDKAHSIEVTFREKDHEHSFSSDWKYDENGQWHACECGAKSDEAAHTFGEWKITKEASKTEKGLKQRVCSVCGYEQTAEISLPDKPADNDTDNPKTGDSNNMTIWIVIAAVAVIAIVVVVIILLKKRKND